MYEPDQKDVYAPPVIEIVDEEPVGPEPPEYRWALTWAIVFILVAIGCSLIPQ